MALHLPVDLADQRAGRIDENHLARPGGVGNGFRHSVGGEDNGPVVRYLVQFLDEDGTPGLQAFHDEAVVDDLMADIDRGTELFQRTLHDQDRTVDARTEAARACQLDR